MYQSCESFWKENSHCIPLTSCLESMSWCQNSSVTSRSSPFHCFLPLDVDHKWPVVLCWFVVGFFPSLKAWKKLFFSWSAPHEVWDWGWYYYPRRENSVWLWSSGISWLQLERLCTDVLYTSKLVFHSRLRGENENKSTWHICLYNTAMCVEGHGKKRKGPDLTNPNSLALCCCWD